MKYASDFRTEARDSLRGKWGIAVLAGLIASMLGAIASQGPQVKLNFSESGANVALRFANQDIFSSAEGWLPRVGAVFMSGAAYLIVTALVMSVILFVLGSVIGVGYAKFILELTARQQDPQLNTLFLYFEHWKTAAAARLLQSVYVLLWSLLFVFPGIVASLSYSMTSYILAENPELTASQALERSKEMMTGNRRRLFWLEFSFIGWSILSAMTLGIGELWLRPYKNAATAAFYREISGKNTYE